MERKVVMLFAWIVSSKPKSWLQQNWRGRVVLQEPSHLLPLMTATLPSSTFHWTRMVDGHRNNCISPSQLSLLMLMTRLLNYLNESNLKPFSASTPLGQLSVWLKERIIHGEETHHHSNRLFVCINWLLIWLLAFFFIHSFIRHYLFSCFLFFIFLLLPFFSCILLFDLSAFHGRLLGLRVGDTFDTEKKHFARDEGVVLSNAQLWSVNWWKPWEQPVRVRYTWIAPDGEIFNTGEVTIDSKWVIAWFESFLRAFRIISQSISIFFRQPLIVEGELPPGLWHLVFSLSPSASASASSPFSSDDDTMSPSSFVIGERSFLVVDAKGFAGDPSSSPSAFSALSPEHKRTPVLASSSIGLTVSALKHFSKLWWVKSVIRSTHYEKHRACTPPGISVQFCVCDRS